MAFIYARWLFSGARVSGRIARIMPIMSIVFTTCIGAVIGYGARAGVSIAVPRVGAGSGVG